MLSRCYYERDKEYARYGERGISVCDRWRESFQSFLEDMGGKPSPKHSLDRIDNDGHYEPGNCRWATPSEQASNRRNAVRITLSGVSLPIREWSARTGIKYQTIYARHRAGLPPEEVLKVDS